MRWPRLTPHPAALASHMDSGQPLAALLPLQLPVGGTGTDYGAKRLEFKSQLHQCALHASVSLPVKDGSNRLEH